MAETQKKRPFIERLLDRYRLIIVEESSFAERVNFKLTRLNVLTVIATTVLLVSVIVFLLVAYTPIRELIPGYSDAKAKKEAKYAMETAQKLEGELMVRERYLSSVMQVLQGNISLDSITSDTIRTLSDDALSGLDMSISKEDSILRAEVAQEERYNLRFEGSESRSTMAALSHLVFFSPLRGSVSSGFDIGSEHYGVDVVAPDNETVKSVLDGHVIISHWTSSEGHVIAIQHPGELISVYKHNSVLLKKAGESVRSGESIAVIGDTGELTDGPHLHFELWYRGDALDPEQFILFD